MSRRNQLSFRRTRSERRKRGARLRDSRAITALGRFWTRLLSLIASPRSFRATIASQFENLRQPQPTSQSCDDRATRNTLRSIKVNANTSGRENRVLSIQSRTQSLDRRCTCSVELTSCIKVDRCTARRRYQIADVYVFRGNTNAENTRRKWKIREAQCIRCDVRSKFLRLYPEKHEPTACDNSIYILMVIPRNFYFSCVSIRMVVFRCYRQ